MDILFGNVFCKCFGCFLAGERLLDLFLQSGVNGFAIFCGALECCERRCCISVSYLRGVGTTYGSLVSSLVHMEQLQWPTRLVIIFQCQCDRVGQMSVLH